MSEDALPQGTIPESPYVDVYCVAAPFPTIAYRSGLTVYEESLVNGQFVGRAWNGAGFINPEAGRFDPSTHSTPQAFWIELDGQLLGSHWEWAGLQQERRGKDLHVVVELVHRVRPVDLRIHTLLDGTPILTRWIEITNRSERPASLSAAFPWSGVLQSMVSDDVRRAALDGQLYSVGYMGDAQWGNEGEFRWHALPPGGYRVDGRYRRGRHRHPMFILRNELTGEHSIGQLAWSGGDVFEFDVEPDWRSEGGPPRTFTRLFLRAGPDAPPPLRVLAPGETVTTPELHLGLILGDQDASIQAMHDHLRQSVLGVPAGLVESGVGPEQEIIPEIVFNEIETAASFGAELFSIDASWYAPPKSNWYAMVGNWQVGSRFPGGLAPFRQRAHELGMRFGLWMEPERLGRESQMAQEHSAWLQRRYHGRSSHGDLDLTRPEIVAWVEAQITRVISEYDLELFRLDFNIDPWEGGHTHRDGFVENSLWRHYEVLYAVFDRLRNRFPNLILENCASGGGRNDLGMVSHFHTTQISDWAQLPRALGILHGITLALPPEICNSFAGYMNGEQLFSGDLDTQFRVPLFGHPVMVGSAPSIEEMVPGFAFQLKRSIELYQTHIRPLLPTCKVFHHTPVIDFRNPRGFCALEYAAPDGQRAVAGIFRLAGPGPETYQFKPRGRDRGRRYQVLFENTQERGAANGLALANEGLAIQLAAPLTSELLVFEALMSTQPPVAWHRSNAERAQKGSISSGRLPCLSKS